MGYVWLYVGLLTYAEHIVQPVSVQEQGGLCLFSLMHTNIDGTGKLAHISEILQLVRLFYIGAATSPAGPSPSVCPVTVLCRGLNPSSSVGMPKLPSFASYVLIKSL